MSDPIETEKGIFPCGIDFGVGVGEGGIGVEVGSGDTTTVLVVGTVCVGEVFADLFEL